MPSKFDGLERVEVHSRAEWRAWLKMHHTRTEGIWLVTHKKHVVDKHLTNADIVEEALCFGWIDSLPRKLDADRTMLYISPRKPKSVWSAVNKARVERLIASKRMTAAGLRKVKTAQADGSWNTLDAVDALAIPADLARALRADRTARKHFDAFPRGSRKIILYWITSARTAGTRAKRIAETVALAAQNIRANHVRRPKV